MKPATPKATNTDLAKKHGPDLLGLAQSLKDIIGSGDPVAARKAKEKHFILTILGDLIGVDLGMFG